MANKFDPDLAEIGSRIVKRREELGMKASELAVQANMDASSLSRIESGQTAMKVETLVKIAEALKVPLSYLQPEKLDQFSDMPEGLFNVAERLKALPYGKQKMLTDMFLAQIGSLESCPFS